MARVYLLTVPLLVLAVLSSASPAVAFGESTCSRTERELGVCSSVAGAEVVLVGQESLPGSGSGAAVSGGGSASAAPAGPPRHPQFTKSCLYYPSTCEREPAAGIPPITINDIATYRPTPGRQQMEPDGWTVAGLDTNFFAITEPHLVTGTLLGRPADVRFTPVQFHWTYGDGAAAVKSTKGGTWAALGIAEFDPTPTSHVYEQLGDYTITLSITFAAEYRFAGSAWRPVVGTITLPANDLFIRVGTAQTVLVEHDCTQNPSGPGC